VVGPWLYSWTNNLGAASTGGGLGEGTLNMAFRRYQDATHYLLFGATFKHFGQPDGHYRG
jgi:hypothetical protein